MPLVLALAIYSCLMCYWFLLDVSLVDAFKEDAGWYWSSSRADVCEFVSFCVVCSGDIIELAAVKTSFERVVELLIVRHVVGYCIAVFHRLLDDEVGVSVDYEASGTACFGHTHAIEQCLVFGFVVGGVAKADLEDVFELGSFGGDQNDSFSGSLLSFGPIEEHCP